MVYCILVYVHLDKLGPKLLQNLLVVVVTTKIRNTVLAPDGLF